MNARLFTTLTAPLLALSLAACGGGQLAGDETGAEVESAGETGVETGEEDGDEDGAEAGIEEGEEDSGEEDSGEGDSACVVQPFALESVTPNVMLVLDKSGSMNSNSWDDDGDSGTPEVTRWSSLHGVVAEMTSNYEDSMSFGLTLFPALDAAYDSGDFELSCGVADTPDVAVGEGSSASLMQAIPNADDEAFGGATPATEGILTAAAHLEGLADEAPDAMVLITDGAANCVSPDDFVSDYDEGLEDAVRDAWEGAGIPTYVVGIDIGTDGGSVDVNPREALAAVAAAGGVAHDGEVGFYDATDPAALESALDEITHRLACQIELDFEPEPGLGLLIEVDGSEVPQVASCDVLEGEASGWAQIDPINQPKRIELCNTACTGAEIAGGSATMCPVIP